MNEKTCVHVFRRSWDGKYILAGNEIFLEHRPPQNYVGEFKIKGKFTRSKIIGAQDLRNYLDSIKDSRKEEIENLPNVKNRLEFEIKEIGELKEKITLKS